MSADFGMSIHRVRPIQGREEALEYLKDMCVYWYEKRPAFPGTPENLFAEMARQLPTSAGAGSVAAAPSSGPVSSSTAMLELFTMVERVIRTNPGGPYVDQLAQTLERVRTAV